MNNYVCTANEFEPIVSNATIADSIARFNPGDVFQVRFLHENDMQKMRSNGRYMTFAFLTSFELPKDVLTAAFVGLSLETLSVYRILVGKKWMRYPGPHHYVFSIWRYSAE